MRLGTSLKVAVITLALAAVGFAQDQGSDNGREFHWTGKLSADQVVVIRNINGSIEANGASGDQIEVSATKSGRGADEVKVRVMKINDGVMICAIYPGFDSEDCESHSHWGNHDNNAKVDFKVSLPKNLRFTAKSVNGSVTAENLGRYVEGDSVNGSVTISTASWASASSVNGSIKVRMGRADWNGTLAFKTVNGGIDVEVPSNLNADVEFNSVNGHLDSDFPLTVQGSIGRHSVHGTIGSGGRTLEMKTVNGSGELHKTSI